LRVKLASLSFCVDGTSNLIGAVRNLSAFC
jgi:hypothetical protein